MKILFRDALIYDGSGKPGYQGELLVEGEKIAAVGEKLNCSDAELVLDCRGLAAAPGFIDLHAHSDLTSLAEPSMASKAYCGVTTEVSGNCGGSPFPINPRHPPPWLREESKLFGIEVDWDSAELYFRRLEATGSALNRAVLCGHGSLRLSVLGSENRAPSERELARMCQELAAALEAGAVGLSSGLIYPPGCFARTEELVELGKVAARRDALYASHIRGEGKNLERAIEEALTIARACGARLQLSHLKTSGAANWHKIDWVAERLERASEEALPFLCDRYPYIASSTSLDAVLPGWVYEGGREKELARLSAPQERARIKKEVEAEHPEADYWSRVTVSFVGEPGLRAWEGQNIADISRQRAQSPLEALLDVLVADRCRTEAIYFGMCEENLERILSFPTTVVGSDAASRAARGVTAVGRPHPRGFGSFPRYLAHYVRERKLLPRPEAIRRITSLPAEHFRLARRGRLEPGYYADLALFDPERFQDRATFEEPFQYATGLQHLLVNGRFVIRDGVLTRERPGKLLRRGGS